MLVIFQNVIGLARAFAVTPALLSLLLAGAPARADDNAAQQAFQRALTQHAAGDVTGALASMQESHRLSGRAELLYNIARIESELGRCSAAEASYRSYLELVPQGRYRVAAEQARAELPKRCSERGKESEPASAAPDAQMTRVSSDEASSSPATPAQSAVGSVTPPARTSGEATAGAPRYWTTQRWVGWSAVAASAAAIGGAIYFHDAAVEARDRLEASAEREYAGGQLADLGLRDEKDTKERWSQVLATTGGALMVTGALLLLFARDREPVRPTVSLAPGLLSVSLSSAF